MRDYLKSQKQESIQPLRVKGDGFLLSVLIEISQILTEISPWYEEFASINQSVNKWVTYLDTRYGTEFVLFGGHPINLEYIDSSKILKEVEAWRGYLEDYFSKDGTKIINRDSIPELFPDSLTKNLDQTTLLDLNDGVTTIFNLLPTPAAMILFRVAENIVRKFYEKSTGNTSVGRTWWQLTQELEESQKMKKVLVGYIDHIRDKRNEAEHPDKTFTQEESERVPDSSKGLARGTLKIRWKIGP